jgi:hypothetical protein
MVTRWNGEQRNRYRDQPPVPWIRTRFVRADGHGAIERALAVDTGDEQAVRIGSADMELIKLRPGPTMQTNFGRAVGGWVMLSIPEIGLERAMLAFATDELVAVVRQISPELAGQVGMQLLRMVEYGGNDHEFWVRSLSNV